MPDDNGITSRVAVAEAAIRALRDDIRELKTEDIKDIRDEVRGMRRDFADSRQGMTRSEKIALAAVGVTVVMAIIAAIALVSQAPT